MREPIRTLLDVDRVVHEPARLLILSILSGAEQADFKFLEASTGMTKGNLSGHLARLEESEYVQIEKTFRGKTPVTTLRITTSGRNALKRYRRQLADLLSS